MSVATKLCGFHLFNDCKRPLISSVVRFYSNETEFKVLNLKTVRSQVAPRKKLRKPDVLPPRATSMSVDQDWGNVWPGPRSFHPATVPLPIRQGYVKKGATPGKFGNAELMKIPNFLHLTPPVIKRQCEALKQFCTPWPRGLETDEKCEEHFPLEVATSNYCHSAPTIRDPLARIVTIKVNLTKLPLDQHARDKFLRLVGDRYDEKTNLVTIVTDRCPLQNQNYDYAMYLLTAVFHESWRVEPWEQMKSEADMEYYDWMKNASKTNIEALFDRPHTEIKYSDIYSKAVDAIMNEGENEYNVNKYGESVQQLLQLAQN